VSLEAAAHVHVGPLHGTGLFVMGSNRFSQLSGASSTEGQMPRLLLPGMLQGQEPMQIAASWRNTYVLTRDRQLFQFGVKDLTGNSNAGGGGGGRRAAGTGQGPVRLSTNPLKRAAQEKEEAERVRRLGRPWVVDCLDLAQHRVEKVACGWQHSLLLTHAAVVMSWGFGGYGALGHGTKYSTVAPRIIDALLGQHVVSIAAGSYSSFALTAIAVIPDHSSAGAGTRRRRLMRNNGHPPGAACSSAEHVQGRERSTGGVLWSWGWGKSGQLGQGHCRNVLVPRAVEEVDGNASVPPVVAAACGHEHLLVLTKAGRVLSCGSGKNGRLGYVCSTEEWRLRSVEEDAAGNSLVWVAQIAAGFAHSALLDHQGDVLTCGQGAHGALGHSFPPPAKPPGGGSLHASPSSDGFSSPIVADSPLFRKVPLPRQVSGVVCGGFFTAAVVDGEDDLGVLVSGSEVWTFGRNEFRQVSFETLLPL